MPISDATKRHAEFSAALILSGVRKRAFAEELGVTSAHLREVLRGRRESPRLVAAIDRFIAKHTPKGPKAAKVAAGVAA